MAIIVFDCKSCQRKNELIKLLIGRLITSNGKAFLDADQELIDVARKETKKSSSSSSG